MKDRIVRQWPVWLGFMLLAIGYGCKPAATKAPAPAPQQTVEASPAAAEQTDTAPAREPGIADAAFHSISTDAPLPPSVRSTGPVAEIIKMANAGADTATMLAFVNRSLEPFELTADEII